MRSNAALAHRLLWKELKPQRSRTVDHYQHSRDPDITVEVPFVEIEKAKRRIDARVENPVDTPHPTETIPTGPEIDNPTETEDPQKADTGPSSRAPGNRRWN